LPSASTTRILGTGQGAARGVEGPLVVIIDINQRHRAVLGHTPCRYDLRPQRLARVFDEWPGDRRAGAQEGAQHRNVQASFADAFREVSQERRRCHRERDALCLDQLDGFLRVPDILQHDAGAEHDRHHQPVHKAGLVRHRRGHQDDIVFSEM
jgi:hypothetical protein